MVEKDIVIEPKIIKGDSKNKRARWILKSIE